MVICLEQGANDLHMVQLMPLPLHHLWLQQNPEWVILLVPAYPGCPGKRPLNICVCVCVCVKSNRCWKGTPRKPQYSGNHRPLEFPVSASESLCTSASKFHWSQSVAFQPCQHSCAAAENHQHTYSSNKCIVLCF